MEQNKFSKYMLYAIGEIILVVVGILIALSINNWNLKEKENVVRRDYYVQIIIDLENDKKYYKKIISNFESFAEGYREYREVFTRQNLDVSDVTLAMNTIKITMREINFPSATINTLFNTGDFTILPQNVRNVITAYLKKQDITKINATGNFKHANNLLEKSSELVNSNLITRLQSHPDIFEYLNIENNIPKLIVLIDSYMIWKEVGEKGALKSFNLLIKDADAIIALINEELKK